MAEIIGRTKEKNALEAAFDAKESMFVVVYGRRRVGKTYLVRETFADRLAFYATGVNKENRKVQLEYFYHALCKYSDSPLLMPKSWMDAFSALMNILERSGEGKKVVFLDELSWMNGSDNSFLTALEWFWNSWASARHDILLIGCSSATSWVVNKVFGNHGGLYGRVNLRIHLHPFTLRECELYYASREIHMSRYDQVMCYMALGGVPYYLSMLDGKCSLAQNFDRLFFNPDGQLHDEYVNLYQAMFRCAENHLQVVSALATKKKGLTRNEILELTGLPNAGSASRILNDLEDSDFVRRYVAFGQKKRDEIYQLTDAYTLFYFHFLKNADHGDSHFWEHHLGSSSLLSWAGYAFERVCLAHCDQLKQAMGISGIAVSVSGWKSRNREHPSQIDLVMDRADRVVSLCEMKFSQRPYAIDKQYAERLQEREWQFEEETKTRKNCQLVMVTTYGLVNNSHASIVQRSLTMDALFE